MWLILKDGEAIVKYMVHIIKSNNKLKLSQQSQTLSIHHTKCLKQIYPLSSIIKLCCLKNKTHAKRIKHTVHAIAVSTATSIWPLYSRSLQPPPAFFNNWYHEDPSETVGLNISIRKFIRPQLGRYSPGYSPIVAKRQAGKKKKEAFN